MTDINNKKQTANRPKGNGRELNKPNYKLMANAFINLYKEVGKNGTAS